MAVDVLDVRPPARIYAPMYCITRLPGGWQIRLGDLFDTFYFSASFYDTRYGDQDRSLAAAQKVRDKQIKRPEFLQWVAARPRGFPNSTGFLGISCAASWRWDSRRNNYERQAAFYVRDDSVRNGSGRMISTSLSFIRCGAWYGYRKAVRLRADFVGQRVSPRVIAQRYDEIFLVNWRDKLEEIGVDWRRD